MSAEISQATINPSATTPVPATAPTSFPGVRYGGFWRRTAAFWVDLALAWLFGTLLLMALRLEVTQPDHFEPRTLLSLGIRLIVAWLYRSVFMSSRAQATPGQLLLNLKITDLEGRRISFARATGRYFAEWISFMICLIGYVMIAFSDRKQALHDKLAGCLVVHAKPSAAAVSPGPGSAAPTGA
ncbi:MAG TPA: RDD family protein [Candidatus Limnocylindria bacterium]|nr:RDD family protein [Candidatus Limnocylindria bacterium]